MEVVRKLPFSVGFYEINYTEEKNRGHDIVYKVQQFINIRIRNKKMMVIYKAIELNQKNAHNKNTEPSVGGDIYFIKIGKN